MHREFQTTVHEGTASEIAEKILKGYAFDVDIDPTKIDYREDDTVLAQANTDLDFLDELAGANGMYFWVDYKVSTSFTGSLEIKEIAHFSNSPPRPQDSSPIAIPPIILAPDSPPKLTINTTDGCSAIKMLGHKSRSEAINQTPTIRRINIDDASLEDTDVPGPTDNALGGNKPPAQKRTCRVVTAGSVEEARVRNQAALNDASWSVDANADTTVFALGGIVAPHQLIQVAGAGKEKDGEYLIRAVTHHINAADHKMHIELQRNPGGG
jgi:phage protein D